VRHLALALLLALPPAAFAGPVLVIEARYHGASPAVVADTLADPLETALAGAENVRRIRSLSLAGRCLLRLELAPAADVKVTQVVAQNRVALAMARFPGGAARQGVTTSTPDVSSFVLVGLRRAGEEKPLWLGTLAQAAVRARLRRVPGVAEVRVLSAGDAPWLTFDSERFAVSPLVGEGEGAGGLARREGGAGTKVAVESAALLVVKPRYGAAAALPKEVAKALTELADKLPAGLRVEQQAFGPGDWAVALRRARRAGPAVRARSAAAAAEVALGLAPFRSAWWVVPEDSDEVLLLLTAPAERAAEVRADLRSRLGALRGVTVRVGGMRAPDAPWPGEGMQVVARVCGNDPVVLAEVAEQLVKRMGRVKGVVDLDPGPGLQPRLTVVLDRRQCQDRGVNLDDVLKTLQIYLGPYDVARPALFPGEVSPVLRVRVAAPPENAVEDLKRLQVRNAQGEMVPLGAMASFRYVSGPASFYRDGGRLCRVVSCNVQGRDVAAVREEARKAAKALARQGVRVEVE
jgi:multidrug efflux pump subunit AcrB